MRSDALHAIVLHVVFLEVLGVPWMVQLLSI